MWAWVKRFVARVGGVALALSIVSVAGLSSPPLAAAEDEQDCRAPIRYDDPRIWSFSFTELFPWDVSFDWTEAARRPDGDITVASVLVSYGEHATRSLVTAILGPGGELRSWHLVASAADRADLWFDLHPDRIDVTETDGIGFVEVRSFGHDGTERLLGGAPALRLDAIGTIERVERMGARTIVAAIDPEGSLRIGRIDTEAGSASWGPPLDLDPFRLAFLPTGGMVALVGTDAVFLDDAGGIDTTRGDGGTLTTGIGEGYLSVVGPEIHVVDVVGRAALPHEPTFEGDVFRVRRFTFDGVPIGENTGFWWEVFSGDGFDDDERDTIRIDDIEMAATYGGIGPVAQFVDLSRPMRDRYADDIVRLYVAVLGRAPDAAGASFWADRRRDGVRRDDVVRALLRSEEFTSGPDRPLADRLFPTLDELPSGTSREELAIWFRLGRDPVDVVLEQSSTQTFAQHTDTELGGSNWAAEELERLYLAAFGRFPDQAGLCYWLGVELDHGRYEILGGFIESAEWQRAYAGLGREQTVRQMYRNILGREPDDAGVAYWLELWSYDDAEGLRWVLDGIAQSEEMQILTASG